MLQASLVACLILQSVGLHLFVAGPPLSLPPGEWRSRLLYPFVFALKVKLQSQSVPIDGRHNARGLDSREFSTARQSIWPAESGRVGLSVGG